MADQYSGNLIVTLMRLVDRVFGRHDDVPQPVAMGGMVVNLGLLKINVGPEVIESLQRIEARKQTAIASGKPSTVGQWQTGNPVVKAILKTVARKAGIHGLFN